MKIIIFNYFQSSTNRGLETYVKELSQRLSKSSSVKVVDSPKITPANDSRLDLFRRFFLDRLSLQILGWTVLHIKDLLEFKPDLILATNGGWQIIILKIYSILFDCSLVISGQSGPGWDDRWNLFFKPNLFVALTESQLNWAKAATIWRQEFAVIPNGVDLNVFKPKGPVAKINLTRPIVICVGAAIKSKRIDWVINAVNQLKEVSLIWIGTGPESSRLDTLGRDLLGSNRYLHLEVDHDHMADYYRSADLFTLCSDRSEAFGIVYPEAMACGLNIVAPNDPSRLEIVGPSGIFVNNPEDPKEYAQAIKLALKRKNLAPDLSFLQKYSWDNIALRYQDMFEKITK